jgi:hypothetical protein
MGKTPQRDVAGTWPSAASIVYLPGEGSSWRRSIESQASPSKTGMNWTRQTASGFYVLLRNPKANNQEGHSQNEECGIELATRQQRQDRSRQKQNRSYQKAPLSNYSLHRYPSSA